MTRTLLLNHLNQIGIVQIPRKVISLNAFVYQNVMPNISIEHDKNSEKLLTDQEF